MKAANITFLLDEYLDKLSMKIKMLYYDATYVSEGIDVNKTGESKEFDICHYWYFLDKVFKFKPDVCNGCHDVFMMSMNLKDIPILNITDAEYCGIISCIINVLLLNY